MKLSTTTNVWGDGLRAISLEATSRKDGSRAFEVHGIGPTWIAAVWAFLKASTSAIRPKSTRHTYCAFGRRT